MRTKPNKCVLGLRGYAKNIKYSIDSGSHKFYDLKNIS